MKFIKHYIFFVCFIAFAYQSLLAQREEIDSLLALVKTDKEDTIKVKHLNSIRYRFELLDDYKSALSYEWKALFLSQILHWKKGEANAYLSIGLIIQGHGNIRESLEPFLKAIAIFNEIGNIEGLADANIDAAYTYQFLGNYTDALKCDLVALKNYESCKNKSGISAAYFGIGDVYLKQGNYPASLKNSLLALRLFKELDEKNSMGAAYSNIALLYMYQKKFTEAIEMGLLSLHIKESLHEESGIAIAHTNIGLIYDYEGNYTEAIKHYRMALSIEENIDDKDATVSTCTNLGTLYIKLHKIKEAETYLNKSLQLSKEYGAIDGLRFCFAALAELDSLKGNFKMAFEHHKLYDQYSDSFYNEETNRKITETTMQYDFDKKEAHIKFASDKIVSDLENKNKLQKQKQFFLIVFIVVFIILVLVVLFFAKRAYDSKKKYSEVLSKENEHKELLLREVHHRVNNSLQMISSLLSIQADTASNEEIREYLLKSENRIQAMSTMHHLLHMGNSKLEVNINQYLGEIINFYAKVLESKPNIKLHVKIPSIDFHTKTALPLALLLNELLTNSIKYAFPNEVGEVRISLIQLDGSSQWLFKISDNGIGFKEGDIGGKGTSLGLSLVKLMSRQIGGKLNVNHEHGTSFELIFNIIPS